MENFAQNYVKLDIFFWIFLFKKGVNPKSLMAALAVEVEEELRGCYGMATIPPPVVLEAVELHVGEHHHGEGLVNLPQGHLARGHPHLVQVQGWRGAWPGSRKSVSWYPGSQAVGVPAGSF